MQLTFWGATSSMNTTCLVTATYRGDLECFMLLRRAVEKFAPEFQHHVLVNTEDYDIFRSVTENSAKVTFIKSDELLTKRLEKLRKNLSSWRFPLIKRLAWRYGMDAAVFRGWKIQQLLKLNYLPQIPTNSAIFLDSDIIPVRTINDSDIYSKGKLLYLESPAVNLEDILFDSTTHFFFKTDLTSRPKYFNYIHPAPRFKKRTGQTFQKISRKCHQNWEDVFCRQGFPSEYDMLGYCMRDIEEYDGYLKHPLSIPDLSYSVQFREDVHHLDKTINTCITERGRRGFLLIQSNLKIPMHQWAPTIGDYIDGFDIKQHS